MMIALDIGGTKTLVKFSSKKRMENFLSEANFTMGHIDSENRYCTFSTSAISREKEFYHFVSLLNSIDSEVISTFPGIVRMEYGNEIRFRVYSKRFPFLMGKYLDFDFVLNDAPAFTYFHAKSYFRDKGNIDKILLGVVVGTGINACYMNFWDFKRLTFINRFFEAGHVKFKGNDVCFCGRRGCAELYVSGKFLERIGEGNPTIVFSREELKDTFYNNLAEFLVSLIITVSPHEVVLGGRVSWNLDMVELKEKVEDRFPHARLDTGIRFRKDVSLFSNIDGLLSAYKRFKQKYHL